MWNMLKFWNSTNNFDFQLQFWQILTSRAVSCPTKPDAVWWAMPVSASPRPLTWLCVAIRCVLVVLLTSSIFILQQFFSDLSGTSNAPQPAKTKYGDLLIAHACEMRDKFFETSLSPIKKFICKYLPISTYLQNIKIIMTIL